MGKNSPPPRDVYKRQDWARSGFFQMVRVTVVNLSVLLGAVTWTKRERGFGADVYKRQFRFRPQTPPIRPKGAVAPFGNPCSETDGGVFLRWDGGRRMGAGGLRGFWGPCFGGDEVGECLVVLVPGLGG